MILHPREAKQKRKSLDLMLLTIDGIKKLKTFIINHQHITISKLKF